jgi:NAD(P)-dependent dehydrogenase (short-subunit alcohol dehydrogenase family)
MSLKGEVALVTRWAGGIRLGVVRSLATEGADPRVA